MVDDRKQDDPPDASDAPEADGEEGQRYDAPNQQVVRADGSAPWDEGEGGKSGEDEPQPQQAEVQAEEEDEEEDEEQDEEPSPPIKSKRPRSRR